MLRKLVSVTALLLFFISCESELYPPTYAPELSNLVITTSSIRSSTTYGYENDTVLFTIDVTDSEDDPYSLDLSILDSTSTEVQTESYSNSRIFDGDYWDCWFDSTGLAVDTYTLNFTATDTDGNVSDVLSGTYDVITDTRLADVTGFSVSFVSYVPRDTAPDEVATLTYTVTHTTAFSIDKVQVVYTVTVDGTDYTETGTLTNVAGGGSITTGTIKYSIISTSASTAENLDSTDITFY